MTVRPGEGTVVGTVLGSDLDGRPVAPAGRAPAGDARAWEGVLQRAERAGAERVDLRVTTLFGEWRHLSVPSRVLTPQVLGGGWAVPAESLPGLGAGDGAPVRLLPDPATAVIDPLAERPTLAVVCDALTADGAAADAGCPRGTVRRATEMLAARSPALSARLGVTVEFFLFDDVRFQQGANAAFYAVDSPEGGWNSGAEEAPNLGYKVTGGGWGVLAPDRHADLRAEVVQALAAVGIEVAADHHGVAGAGHQSVTLAEAGPVALADAVQWTRHVVRQLARRRGCVATFMPRPLGGRGSALPLTLSLWDGDRSLLSDPNGYGLLSREGRWLVGGLLRNGPTMSALLMPSTNSYRGFAQAPGAPSLLCYGTRGVGGAVRIPVETAATDAGGRVAYLAADAAANPYLAAAALLVGGYDGVRNRYDAGDPLDRPPAELGADAQAALRALPASLEAAVAELVAGAPLLRRDEVFTQAQIDRWVERKRAEVAQVEAQPTPVEYELYFNG